VLPVARLAAGGERFVFFEDTTNPGATGASSGSPTAWS
jgi:hypothetical protein